MILYPKYGNHYFEEVIFYTRGFFVDVKETIFADISTKCSSHLKG